MEGFSNLNWDTPVDEDLLCFFKKDVFEKCSAACHQMYGLHQSPWPDLDSSQTVADQLNSSEAIEWDPVKLKREQVEGPGPNDKSVKINLPKPFPRRSNLSTWEQKDYMYTMMRVMKSFTTGAQLDALEMMKFKELQEKVKDETQEFQKFAQQLVAEKPGIYSFLTSSIIEYSTSAWKNNLLRVQSYPAHYKPRGSVLLIPKESAKSCTLILDKTVLEMGQIPRICFPPGNTPTRFLQKLQKISTRFPPDAKQGPTVSKDGNAKKIAIKYNVDFVMSASTLSTLAANIGPLFRDAWEIPITVVEEKTTDGKRKTVYLDKPLPPKEMSAVDRNFLFNVASSKFHLIRKGRTSYYYPGCTTTDTLRSTDPFDSGDADLSELETFGVDVQTPSVPTSPPLPPPKSPEETMKSPQPPKTPPKIDAETASSAPSESDSDTSLIIDLGSSPSKKLKNAPSTQRRIMTRSAQRKADTKVVEGQQVTKTTNSTSEGEEQEAKLKSSAGMKVKGKPKANVVDSGSNLLSSILQDQEKMMQDGKKKVKSEPQVDRPEDPKDYQPIVDEDNATYRVWTLKGNDDQMRLLIRTSVDAVGPKTKEELRTYLIVPKLEYQPWFGAENLTVREFYQQWINCYVRPGCRIFRPRLDVYTGDLMMQEQRDATFLTADSTHRYGLQFQAPNCLNTVWAVLSSLRELDLSAGSYLLQHGPLDGISVHVLHQCEKQDSTYDLHQTYNKIDTSATAVRPLSDQWIPLDPWTVLPVQRALGRVPLTFEPFADQKSAKGKPGKTGKAGKTGKGNKAAAKKGAAKQKSLNSET